MPRVTTVQTNFTGGEISPRLLGRVDLEKYSNAAKTLENTLPLIHGGARNHYGTFYVANARLNNKKSRLIPFVYSKTQAYILEFSDLFVSFFANNAQILSSSVPYTVATPYTESELFDIEYVQSADTMFLFHPAHPPYRVRRFADNLWDVTQAPFDVIPFGEVGDSFATSLTLSSSAVGTGRTATASAATFLQADVGRTITYLGGTFKITGFTSTTIVTGDITTPFTTTAIPVSAWTLNGSPRTDLTPGAKSPVETATTLTAAVAAFRTTDVGKYVNINGGLMLITGYTSSTIVNATIKQELTGVVSAPADSWILNAAMWSSTLGYPTCGTLYQQRLVVAGSTKFPQTVWGSAINDYLNFQSGTLDDDSFQYTLAADELNPIVHLIPGKELIALTYGGEFTMKGGIEKPITPTNVQVDAQSTYGSSAVKPFKIGKETLLMQRTRTKLRAMKYYAADDAYDSIDLTAFSEHITGTGIVDASYAQEPDPIVWLVRDDGQIATMSFSREQNVQAWARRVTNGMFESVATIPTINGDQTWCVVKRALPSGTVRYVERFDSSAYMDSMREDVVLPPGATVWSGYTHLEGMSVAVIADGSDMGNFTIAGGSLTLPRAAQDVAVGLAFTATIDMVTPEVQTPTGSAQSNQMSTHRVALNVLTTQVMKMNGYIIPFREFGSELLDDRPPTFTGIKDIMNIGWGKGESTIKLTVDRPFRFHILSVIRQFTVNTGGGE